LPVINHFLGRLGLDSIVARHLRADDARLRPAPATVIGVVVRNLIIDHRPDLCAQRVGDPFEPTLLGLTATTTQRHSTMTA